MYIKTNIKIKNEKSKSIFPRDEFVIFLIITGMAAFLPFFPYI
jgi:hypothetical protein